MRARTYAPLAPAAAMLLLAGCSGSAGSSAERPAEAPPMRLVAYDGCDALLDGLRGAAAERVGPYGLEGLQVPLAAAEDGGTALNKGAVPAPADGRSAAAPGHSTTNSHEAAADEPDIVKTDGRRIVALARGRLQVIDAASRKVVHTLSLGERDAYPFGGGNARLLLSGDRALVVTPQAPMILEDRPSPRTAGAASPLPPGPARPQTRMTLVDLSGAPKVVGTMTSDGSYIDARQTGATVRVVVRSSPRVAFPTPPRTPGDPASEREATERNRQIVRKAPLDAWLPGFTVGEGKAAKTFRTPCDQVSRSASYTGTTMLTVLTLDLGRGLADPSPVGVAADGDTVYGNGSSLYITGAPPRPPTRETPRKDPAPAAQRTDIHKFDVRGAGRPRYVASGSVTGTLLNQYALSEFGGHLRVATTDAPQPGMPRPGTSAPPSTSTLYVLAQNGPRLEETGRAGGLGKGERIYSVRYIGATAYVVTFRQVDPLYVLDLKDPRRPRVTGELKINGYSAYLHPMADGKILGIGQDADGSGRTKGLQASLFDVGGEPRRVGVYRLPGASSESEFEPHAFMYWPSTGLTVVPVSGNGGGMNEALALKVTGTGITKSGTVRHPGRDYGNSIRRSLMVGGTLWTFSEDGARATDAATLADRAWLPFTAG
ncbi:beta-propeller domain-containing protein [Actinomadura graeca]|uniref:Beta-propeller domain-containing protein n=1 Tax=Actinomadura graeca TaxID=2750812 RepID=A0ABX8R793_9ACTN|nr:beta-propeller domain-containing protein [Actinomadura graeca]QXJ24848.1 beta-propeller domain-containing protein [Actinomadura graeca]